MATQAEFDAAKAAVDKLKGDIEHLDMMDQYVTNLIGDCQAGDDDDDWEDDEDDEEENDWDDEEDEDE